VTKFDLCFEKRPPLPKARLDPLNDWRRILFDLGLLGEETTPAGRVGFGNVSQRLRQGPKGREHFLITATQTGGKPILTAKDYCIVTAWDLDAHRVYAQGPAPPSSESLTHAAIYAIVADAQFVFHVHSALIWSQASRLGLPTTAAHIPYGTVAMAQEMRRLLVGFPAKQTGILAMAGHTNGIIGFGETAEATGAVLIQTLGEALARA
jgi:ribulose-5-phosphate 4-epimerase/fuculose-1-phosphate aldolase